MDEDKIISFFISLAFDSTSFRLGVLGSAFLDFIRYRSFGFVFSVQSVVKNI